jgi:hypothetical protein
MPDFTWIILDRLSPRQWRYALWADVPAARQPFYARVGATSAWAGASGAQNTALAAGQIAERVNVLEVPAVATVADIKTELDRLATAYQTEITNTNPWVRYGTRSDGTTVTQTGVA